jgi:hypothetical protein
MTDCTLKPGSQTQVNRDVQMKIHIVDGTYELFRTHFGAPPKKALNGMTVAKMVKD